MDRAIRVGFDGAFLDLIFAYEDIPANSAGTNRQDLAAKMVGLIARISRYAKAQSSTFKIMPQNNPELRTFPNYLPAIDGLAMENMYYLDTGEPCTEDWCQENIDNATAVLRAGKPVLSVDYPTEPADVLDAYARSRAAGFVPYVSLRGLPACYLSGVAPLTACRHASLAPTATHTPSATLPAGSTLTPTAIGTSVPTGTGTTAPTLSNTPTAAGTPVATSPVCPGSRYR